MRNDLQHFVWPLARLDAAVSAVCRRARYPLAPPCGNPNTTADASDAGLEWALRSLVGHSDLEVESVTANLGELQRTITHATPVLLQIERSGQKHLLILLSVNGRRAQLLDAHEEIRTVKLAEILQALAAPLLNDVGPSLDRVFEKLGDRPDQRKRFSLASEMFSTRPLCVGWQIRLAPTAPLWEQASELGLPKLLAGTLFAAAAASGMWVVSWWLLGWAILVGRLEFGWLLAWMLAIATMIPFRLLVTSWAGRFTVLAGAIIKRRLMYGAVNLDEDQTRGRGVGQLLTKVLESEVLDSVAVSGGFQALLATVDLCLAFFVLSFGAAAYSLIGLLCLTIGIGGCLAVGLYRRRQRWTDQRECMTDDLIEKMQGHRTRLVQTPTADWHRGEDGRLCDYLESSRRVDQRYQMMRVGLPRVWVIAALVAVAFPFVYADPSSTQLAVTIGGILLVYFALQSFVEAAEKLIAALVAWQQVRPLWHVACGKRPSAVVGCSAPAEKSVAVLEADGLSVHLADPPQTLFEEIDLRLPSGGRFRLTGESGCGKSVFATTLAGLQLRTQGAVRCHGIDRQSYGEQWQRQVALAASPQQNHLLLGTFAFNALLGRRWPTTEVELVRAETVCRRMGLGSLIDRMPCGMHEIVGETGWQLSHGERCRLFAARAILQEAEVAVIDGLLSSLDPKTQVEVLTGFGEEERAIVLVD